MRCGTKSRESPTGCVPAAPTERCCSSSSEIVFDASRLFELNAQRERSGTVTAMNATAVEELVETSATFFNGATKRISTEAQRVGWAAADFAVLAHDSDHDRTVRYRNDGRAVISVKLHGRPAGLVLNDLVDGICHANRARWPRLYSVEDFRGELWRCAAGL